MGPDWDCRWLAEPSTDSPDRSCLDLARALALCAPEEGVLVAVEAGDLVTVGGPLTEDVRGAVDRVVAVVEDLVTGKDV